MFSHCKRVRKLQGARQICQKPMGFLFPTQPWNPAGSSRTPNVRFHVNWRGSQLRAEFVLRLRRNCACGSVENDGLVFQIFRNRSPGKMVVFPRAPTLKPSTKGYQLQKTAPLVCVCRFQVSVSKRSNVKGSMLSAEVPDGTSLFNSSAILRGGGIAADTKLRICEELEGLKQIQPPRT